MSGFGEFPLLSPEEAAKRVVLIDCISIKLEEHFKRQMKKFSRALILVYEKKTKSENAREQVKATWGAGINNSAQEFSS